jgi:hypothetical protein
MVRGGAEVLVECSARGPGHARGWSPFAQPEGIGNGTTGISPHGVPRA